MGINLSHNQKKCYNSELFSCLNSCVGLFHWNVASGGEHQLGCKCLTRGSPTFCNWALIFFLFSLSCLSAEQNIFTVFYHCFSSLCELFPVRQYCTEKLLKSNLRVKHNFNFTLWFRKHVSLLKLVFSFLLYPIVLPTWLLALTERAMSS